jgi:amidase
MTKSVYDLAVLLDAISGADDKNSFVSSLTNSWENIGVATLDPEVWKFPDSFLKPVPEATEQIVRSSASFSLTSF